MLSAELENVIFYKMYQVLRIKMSLNPLPKNHVMLAGYLKALQCIIPTADTVPGFGASAENDGKQKSVGPLEGRLLCSES